LLFALLLELEELLELVLLLLDALSADAPAAQCAAYAAVRMNVAILAMISPRFGPSGGAGMA
jgi:hypothetical protein